MFVKFVFPNINNSICIFVNLIEMSEIKCRIILHRITCICTIYIYRKSTFANVRWVQVEGVLVIGVNLKGSTRDSMKFPFGTPGCGRPYLYGLRYSG